MNPNNNHNYKGPHYSYNRYIKNKKDKLQSENAEKELAELVGYKPTDNKQANTGKGKRGTKNTTVCQACNIF